MTDVIVVGGGLAGMSAATALHDAGLRVLLIEQRKLPGGRAGSFRDVATGRLLDNCQHVLLGCCTELIGFYRRLGVGWLIEFQDRIVFADNTGHRATMQANCLPAPLHLGASMAGFDLVSPAGRLQIALAMMDMASIGSAGRRQFTDISFADYLRSRGQSAETIRRFWDAIIVSALNATCENAAASFGLQVFQEAFLFSRDGYQVGFARAPLSRLYQHLDFPVVLGRTVQALTVQAGRVVGVNLAAGNGSTVPALPDSLKASHVVLAVPSAAAVNLLGADLLQRSPALQGIASMRYAPIIGAHLFYDRPVLDIPNLAMIGTHLHWAFVDREDPCLIHGVVSAAGGLCTQSTEQLGQLFDAEIRQVIPSSRSARLLRSVIVKEKRATFCPLPGVDHLRPIATTGIPGLSLAGDYTQTGWPATMEGAVRSGRLAAAGVFT